jgi:hypothetical protein
MQSELSPAALKTRTFRVPDQRAIRRPRGDVLAVAVLIALPVLVFGVPALLGHPVYPGDDLTQNFPLRVLAGRQIQSGHLPLYDPYIWSGAPLLGGWNAGAAYPLTILFAIMPAVAAWTLNMIGTWVVAGLGMFVFLRALHLGSLPSLLGALSFAFAGAMSAQVSHFGLVAGMSWVPVQLFSVLRLTQDRSTASRLRWIAVLAVAVGLTILAGEPRAISNAVVIVVIYAAWRVARLGRRCGPAAVSVAAGLALGVCLGAVQWLPGLAAISTSQRAASSAALFNSGSLPAHWLLLMLVPDLLGGSGSFGQPSFFATYNLTEVTSYVGILPLVAAAVLLARFRLRPRPPEWIVWHVIALVGVVLTLGGNTPVGHLLVHLPLFGDQRLQSRNIMVTDLALAVLLAYWADHPLGERAQRFLRARCWRRIDPETALGVLPPLAVIAVVVAGLCWGTGLMHWLGTGLSVTADAEGRLKPWLIPYAVLGVGAIAFLLFGRRLRPGARVRWLAGFLITDLVVFTLLGVVAVDAGLGRAAEAPGGGGASAARQILFGAGTSARTPATRPVADLGYRGRFAIYDPNEIDARQLPVLGSPDLNSISSTPSVQGYSSIVDGRYATATGSHQATGEGQDVLSPRAVGDGTLDQLDTSVLLTVPGYLMTAQEGSGPPAGPPSVGQREIAAGHQTTWYFGTSLAVSKLEVTDPDAVQNASAVRIGLLTPGGAVRWLPARAAGGSGGGSAGGSGGGSAGASAGGSVLSIQLARPVTAVAVIGQAGRGPNRLGPPSVTGPDGTTFVADGQLQDALVPPRWTFAGQDGPFAVFADHLARGPLALEALPGRSAAGASVTKVSGPADEPTTAEVRSPHGVRVVRAVAAIPGWTATWHPRNGPPVKLAVHRTGLVQAVDVPPGAGVLTWSYAPPGFTVGVVPSLAAVALIPLLLLPGRRWRRRRGPPGPQLRSCPRPAAHTVPSARCTESSRRARSPA